MEPILEINNLNFKYSKYQKEILKNLNFKIEHQINFILGLNGIGKSTLLKIITGIEKKYKGEIILKNTLNIKKLSNFKKSKIIAYVSQLTDDNNDFLVNDFLRLNLYNQNIKSLKKQNEIISKYAKQFEIENLINKNYNELSGGEKQIINIVSAFVQNSEIIILDEPTSALDLANKEKILSIIKNNADKKIFIISSHEPNYALLLNAYVYIINNSQIQIEGFAKDIINKDNMQKIYGDSICYSNELEYKSIDIKIK
ncbi:MAG: ABC transporter ATP-binding protein [Metamycoplasmataceae bacterium]